MRCWFVSNKCMSISNLFMKVEMKNEIRVNGNRLWNALMAMAEIGPGVKGGSNRQSLTDVDSQGRRLFQSWREAAGLSVNVDQMGTMFAMRAGTDPNALPVYIGSHLDTQPTGGKYDGVLGVPSALEAARMMNDLDIKTKHPIVVTNWTNEEGLRFVPSMRWHREYLPVSIRSTMHMA